MQRHPVLRALALPALLMLAGPIASAAPPERPCAHPVTFFRKTWCLDAKPGERAEAARAKAQQERRSTFLEWLRQLQLRVNDGQRASRSSDTTRR